MTSHAKRTFLFVYILQKNETATMNSGHSMKVVRTSPSLQDQLLIDMQMNLTVPLSGVTSHKYFFWEQGLVLRNNVTMKNLSLHVVWITIVGQKAATNTFLWSELNLDVAESPWASILLLCLLWL